MAHIRTRHIETYIDKLIKFTPILGILGHRQSGKTTTMSSVVKTYVTMDQRASALAADADPDGFIAKMTGIMNGIDECQLAPALFPALKERVRLDKRPGQFILTGSVRFTSRKAIRESLTGRIVNIVLHPMVVTELLQIPESKTPRYFLVNGVTRADDYFSTRKLSSSLLKEAAKILGTYGEVGGLPGVCFIRDGGIRNQKLNSQLETILDRDLRQIFPTTLPFETIRRVLSALAMKNAQPIEWSEMSRTCRVSVPTLRKLIPAFESLFLFTLLEAEGSERRPAPLFEDPGELNLLTEGRVNDLDRWTSTVLTHVRTIFDLPLSGSQKFPCRFSQYRTRGGAYIPLVVRSSDMSIGVIPMVEENPGQHVLASARSFLKANPTASVLCVHPHQRAQLVSKNILSIPGHLAFL